MGWNDRKIETSHTKGDEDLHIVSCGRGIGIPQLLIRVEVRADVESESIDPE